MALTGTELVTVQAISATGFPAASTELVTTQAIANLGGGGGGGSGVIKTNRAISSGLTDIATVSDGGILWNSATLGAKTQTIPMSTGSLQTIVVFDYYGNSDVYPITITPVSGNINKIFTSVDISTPGDSITLIDSLLGWVLQ